MPTPPKPDDAKRRKRTVAQILKKSYQRYCRDEATRHALKRCLRG